MTENKLEILAEPGERTIVTRRVVNAPRALVYEAFTKPEHPCAGWGRARSRW